MATDRSPTDRAIEHAEHLAKAADVLIEAINALAMAEIKREDGEFEEGGEDYAARDVFRAKIAVDDAMRDVRGCVYEFRKRRDRAAAAMGERDA